MNKQDKYLCKNMILQAMNGYTMYKMYNVAAYAERRLVWDSMEAVLDYLPVDDSRKYDMRQYCDAIMSRLLDL